MQLHVPLVTTGRALAGGDHSNLGAADEYRARTRLSTTLWDGGRLLQLGGAANVLPAAVVQVPRTLAKPGPVEGALNEAGGVSQYSRMQNKTYALTAVNLCIDCRQPLHLTTVKVVLTADNA